MTPITPKNPCSPSPCGPNAHCKVQGDRGVCECTPEYHGNPFIGCRPECISNSECSRNQACINNKCKDPCIGTCGIEAICTVFNHIPTCSCPEGTIGDAFRYCEAEPKQNKPQEDSDPCYPSPCKTGATCKRSGKSAICECIPGYSGNPYERGCYPECSINSDCVLTKACSNYKCVNPCSGDLCGYSSICSVINHSPICSCPEKMVGDPFIECKTLPAKTDPCYPSPCATNGICRVINGIASCQYPECVQNEDCSSSKACFSQKCGNPCLEACGVNALCNVINHKAVCSCPRGFMGSPYSQCSKREDEQPRPECISDDECSNEKACINQKCINPCSESKICGQNSECHVQAHRPSCSCRAGFTGNAHYACYEIGCRSDSECAPSEACVNRECTDPCKYTQCGRNAVCKTDYNHKARCHCYDGYRGNPLLACERPECTRNDECSYNLACQNERCVDPCQCAPSAQCIVNNHIPSCRCPPGYTGNPATSCNIVPLKPEPQCRMDADCPSKHACFSGNCKNPCFETKPCGLNAVCSVEDTLPLRTMVCTCNEGYIKVAEKECKLGIYFIYDPTYLDAVTIFTKQSLSQENNSVYTYLYKNHKNSHFIVTHLISHCVLC